MGVIYLPQIQIENEKTLIDDGQVFYIKNIKIETFLPPGYTWGYLVYLIYDTYLFTVDTIWFGVDSGYAFLNRLTEYKASQ